MNFLDSYEVTSSATPDQTLEQPTPTLNEEVNQVIGQLGRFWGDFRKQSQQALEVAKNDFSGVVVQAQKELSKLTVGNEPKPSTSDNQGETNPIDTNAEAEPSASAEKAMASTSISREPLAEESSTTFASSQSFLSRLQSSLPPNMVSIVQNNLPESIRSASGSIDFGHLRSTLVSDFQRVQGVTRTQAEEYFHKSETLLREAVKEAGEVLKDAVRVIPPEEASTSRGPVGMLWDGTDLWMLPMESNTSPDADSGTTGGSSRATAEPLTAAAVATRAEALLRRLKHDPAILRRDAEMEESIKADFSSWREKEVESKEGGINGIEWSGKIAAALEDTVDGQALKQLEETLVPSEMTKSVFWLRFFFRSHQIRTEEEKRKALIQSTTETEEEFSWEDDEEDAATANKSTPALPIETEVVVGPDPSQRVNSSDSFDLVSAASVSANVSVVGDADKIPKAKADEDEDGDSDWE